MFSRFEDERCRCTRACWCRRPLLWRLRYTARFGHRVGRRGLATGFEMRESPDPWRGRQPRYEKIVRRGPRRFELVTKLPSGKPIAVPLGRFVDQTGERD